MLVNTADVIKGDWFAVVIKIRCAKSELGCDSL